MQRHKDNDATPELNDPGRLLARVTEGILGLDRDGRCHYANEGGARQFGLTPRELVGRLLWSEVPQAAGVRLHQACEKALAEQRAQSLETDDSTSAGHVELHVYPSPDGVSIFFREVPAHRRAERESDALIRQILGSAQEGIVVFDRELRCVEVNPAAAKIMDVAQATIMGRRPTELSTAPALVTIENAMRRAIAGEVVTMPDQPAVRLAGGPETWVSRLMCPLRDRAGEIVGGLLFVRDVSERVVAERRLRANQERLGLALEAANAGIWDWDLQIGRIVWSPEHERLWGLAPGSFRGTYEEFEAPLHPDDRVTVREELERSIAARAPFSNEFRLIDPDGTERWMSASGRTVDSEGPGDRMLGTVVEVTNRKRAELLLLCQGKALERIARGASLTECLEFLAIGAEALAPGLACSILLLDESGRHLRHCAAPSLPPAYIEAIDGAAIGPAAGTCGVAAFTGLPAQTEDIALDPNWDDFRALALPHGLRSCWSTPLFDHRGRVRGTFALYYRKPGLPAPWHSRLIAMATRVAEIALEHDRQQTEVVAAEARYEDLYENAPDMYLSIDPRTRAICDCNGTLARVTGYERAELLGRDVLELYDPADVKRVRQAAEGFLRTGEVRDIELRIRCKDGSMLDVSLNATAIRGADGTILRSRSIWRDITRQRRAEDDRRALTAQLLRSQEVERQRIARELHDSTGQCLAALAMNLALLERRAATPASADSRSWLASPDVPALLSECASLTERSADEIRTLSYLLHPPLLEDFGLGEAIKEYVAGFVRRSGLQVAVEVETPVPDITEDAELALFRVVQESLANVHRHSGSAWASVRLARETDHVVLEIRDSGSGVHCGDVSVGVGIPGMRERLRLIGGQLEIEGGPDGTCVRATVSAMEGGQ